jgi:hypothetical protein
LTRSFQSRCGPRVYPATDRNEYRESSSGAEGGRRIRLTTSPIPVSRLPRTCGSFSVFQVYMSTRPVTRKVLKQANKFRGSKSASEQYRLIYRLIYVHFSGWRGVAWPARLFLTAVNFGFLDWSCYFLIQVAPHLSSRG